MGFFSRKKGIPNEGDKDFGTYTQALITTAIQLLEKEYPGSFSHSKFEGQIEGDKIKFKGKFKITETKTDFLCFEYDGESRVYEVIMEKSKN